MLMAVTLLNNVAAQGASEEEVLLPSEEKITKIITSVYDGLGFETQANSTHCKEAILEAIDIGY